MERLTEQIYSNAGPFAEAKDIELSPISPELYQLVKPEYKSVLRRIFGPMLIITVPILAGIGYFEVSLSYMFRALIKEISAFDSNMQSEKMMFIAILVILALVMIGIGVLGLKIVGYLTIGQIISIKRSCIEPVIVTGCKEVQTSGKGRLYENIYYLPFKCVYCINIENHSYEVGYKRIMVKQKPKSKSYYVTDADFLFSDTTVFEQMWNDILY
ncbi:MAG: hypothetical protein J6A58_08245 [Oscillospiraceae bacterium]|nr:hypothetical protein [Oscillospiraceae bacterium]